MVAVPLSEARECDVFVVGAGLAGAAAAIAFARAGFSVVSCGALDRMGKGRTVALLGKSVEFLRRLEVWDAIENAAAPLRSLRIIDDTGSLFAPRPIEFHASEIGLDAFGWNIENAALADIFAAPLSANAGVRRIEARVERFAFEGERATLETSDGQTYRARLVIGADGRASASRRAAGLEMRQHPYGQNAITLFLTHSRRHDDFSTEFHTRQGPFTLVPLPPSRGGEHRSSLVWVMKEAEAIRRAALDDVSLCREIEKHSRGLLGAMRIEGERGMFPMLRQTVSQLAATRLGLVGDAAHAFPPIGAQGLNLGLRDVEGLLGAAVAARDESRDIGGADTLSAYARRRAPDVMARTFAVDGLNMSLLANLPPIDALRGLGLAALGRIGPLRRMVMREGVTPALAR